MTLRIRRLCENRQTRICLSGALRSAHLASLRAEVEQLRLPAILDLDEITVVDIDGIRLLNDYQAQGIEMVNCPPYIREWMFQERQIPRNAL